MASAAQATPIVLSTDSSDATPASSLDATLDFVVLGGNVLQLTVTNDTTAPNEFMVNRVYWNGSASVSSLSLLTATHSANGDVFSAWDPVEFTAMADGFGTFDFALTDGVGATNPNIIQPSASIVFTMSITGSCATALNCTAADFIVLNGGGYLAAGKFVSGPGDDSAFGAVVPEPTTVLLLGSGLLGLAIRRRSARVS